MSPPFTLYFCGFSSVQNTQNFQLKPSKVINKIREEIRCENIEWKVLKYVQKCHRIT